MNYQFLSGRRRATGPSDLYSLAVQDSAAWAYKFNEASGTLVNAINPGTYDLSTLPAGGATYNVTGVSGPDTKAVTTLGGGGSAPDYGHFIGVRPSLNGNKTFSCECVFKNLQDVSQTLFSYYPAGELNTAGRTQISPRLRLIGGASYAPNLAAVNDGAFHHFIVTWDGTTAKTYWQGALLDSAAVGVGDIGLSDNTTVMAVGGIATFNTQNINATFDFLAVYT